MRIIPNTILAFSNAAGFPALMLSMRKGFPTYTGLISAVMISSFAHHLTETNEMGHMLPGIAVPYLSRYGKELRYMDIVMACTLTGCVVWRRGMRGIQQFVRDHHAVLSASLACSFSCDFIISKRPRLYTALHLPWHIGIYYIVYRVVDSETTKEI
jgi:hypothetical protein